MGNTFSSCADCDCGMDHCGMAMVDEPSVPKHISVMGHKWLNPDARACPLCASEFTLFYRKHFCRRCNSVVCLECSSKFIHLQGSEGISRVCDNCYPALTRNIINELPASLWWHILEYIKLIEVGCAVYTCRATLCRGLPVPYKWIPEWSAMFGPKVFLNEGAYGKVFQTVLASNPMQQVAVKVMKKQNLFTLKHWRTVIREVEVHMRIKHPLAIQMIDVVQDDTMLYLVLELAKGGDAFDWVVKQQGIPERLAATVARNLLEFADNIYTSMHVVHRDLKLENILLMEVMRDAPWRGEDMLIKVADFGLAKFLLAPDACAGTAEKQGSLTVQMLAFDVGGRSGNFATPCGTLGYTAPEVLHPGSKPKLQNADSVHKLDVYSIGVILHILLTGAEPYPSSNLRDHLRRAARGIRTTDNIYRNVTLEARAILKRMVGPSFERPTAREALKTEFFSPPSPVPGTLPAQSPPTANITPTTETEFLQKAKKLVRMKEIVYDVTRDGIVVMRQLKNTQRRQSWNEAPALRSALSMDDTMQYYSVDLPLAEGVSPAMSPRSGGTPILPTPSPMQSPLNALDPSQVTSSNRNISPGGGANGFQARSRRHMSVNMGNISSQKRRQNFLSGMYNPVLKTKSNNNYM